MDTHPVDTTPMDPRRLGQAESGDQPSQRRNALRPGDVIAVQLFRYDPDEDSEPRFESYAVPFSPHLRVLDVLNYISEDLESDLAYRWSCGVKKCGTCAVRVNGREVLACWEPAELNMKVEPLRHLPIIRDLVVDRKPYEDRVLKLEPWLQRGKAYSGFPERIGHHEMLPALKALDCVSCMSCYSVCPVLDLGDDVKFVGPAPLVQMAQAALDPRDEGNRGRLAAETAAVFDCVSCYKCEEVCPVHIPIVTSVIEPLKRLAYRANIKEARHTQAFMEIVKERGLIDPTSLILKSQGIKALAQPIRALALLTHGKINLARTLLKRTIPGIAQVRKLFEDERKPS